jgi:LTXXQ motif family protein
MRNTRKLLVGAIAAAALAASGAVVYAQPAGPGAGWQDCPGAAGGPGAGRGPMGYGPGAGRGGPGMMGYGPGAGRGGPGMMHHGPGAGRGGMWSNPAAAVEGHLAALKVELKITPEQESAWKTFTDKARQQAETMPARRAQMIAQMQATDQSAPDRLAKRTEFAKQRIASMETMTAAVKDLYAALTPEQKTLADRQLAHGPMGGGGRGMGGWRGFRG